MAEAIAADRLRSFVERIERLRREIKELNADVSEVYKEAASAGFDKAALKEVIRRRAKDQYELELLDETVGLYLSALGEKPVSYARARAREEALPVAAE